MKKENKKDTYDKDAFVRFTCEGLNGKGCGTDPKKISQWRKELSWEERCRKFRCHEGD